MLHEMVIRAKLEEIFGYRRAALEKKFGESTAVSLNRVEME